MSETNDVICGDGMCPFVPCSKFPNCVHVHREIKQQKGVKHGIQQ